MQMARIVLLLTFLTLALGLYEQSQIIQKLDESNYHQQTRNGVWLVVLYKHTCPHCIRFQPKMIKAASGLKGILKIGAFDCVSQKPQGLKVHPVPRLLLIVDGQIRAMKQEQTTEAIVHFVLSNLRKVIEKRIGKRL